MRVTAVVGVLVAVAVLAASAAAQDFAFAARVGDSHHPLAAGTTNLGAVGALAVLGTSPAGIDVFPRSGNGYGAGTFNALDVAVGAPSDFTEFRDPTSGSVDFAVVCANGIAIGVTDGNGHFTFHVIPLTGANGGHIVSGDFNHDGRPDLAFTEPLGNNIGIALNTGGTNFTSPRAISVPQSNIGDIEVGNFTADATPDVVVATGSGVTFFNGVGDGTFGLPIALQLNAHPTSIAAADIDLDGLTDIVVGEGNGVEVMENQTAAGAIEVFSGRFLQAGTAVVGVLVADVNDDNRADVLALNRGSGTLSTWFDSSSGFGARDDVPVGSDPISVTVTRFNDDAFQDVAVVHDTSVDVYTGSPQVQTGGGNGTSLPFVSSPAKGPGTGHKRTPNETISPPKAEKSVRATISGTYFWDINVPMGKKPLACGLFDAKTNRQIRKPLFPGVKQKQSCFWTHKTRIVHGVKKQIVHIALDLTTTKTNAKGSATVWTEVFWR